MTACFRLRFFLSQCVWLGFLMLASMSALANTHSSQTAHSQLEHSPASGVPTAGSEDLDAAQYRTYLNTALNLAADSQMLMGFDLPAGQIQQAQAEIQALDSEALNRLRLSFLSQRTVEEWLREGREGLDVAIAQASERSSIDIPDVEVDPAFCANTTGASYGAAVAAEKTIKLIFAALKFECQQTLLGENGALACLAPALLVIVAENATRLGEFCLNEQRAGKGEAILQLDRNIGAHLNTFIDDTTTSSRATQSSLDDAQSTITTALSDLSTLQSTLDSGFITINNDLNTQLEDLANLQINLTDLLAVASDIQFRLQVNQVEAEDVQERTADLQERSSEIRSDTQSILSAISALQSQAETLTAESEAAFVQLQRDRIAVALATPDGLPAEYALPAEQGGQLEEAREVLTRAINQLNELGINTTSTALSLLSQGDDAYNQRNYLLAFRFYAQAYQSLTNSTRR